MACLINLRTDGLSGADSGGTWTWNGHHASSDTGPFSTGTGTDPGTLTGDNPQIDFDGFIPGFYSFTYGGGEGDCGDEVDVIIAVVPSVNAGCDETLTYCTGTGGTAVDLLALKNTECAESITDDNLTIEWDNSSDDPGAEFNAGAGTLNIDNLSAGTYVFNFIKTVEPPAGYTLEDCPNCATDEATLTIVVQASFDAGTAQNIAVCA